MTFRALRVFREFRDSQLPPKRPVQQRLEQILRLALGFALLGALVVGQTLRVSKTLRVS